MGLRKKHLNIANPQDKKQSDSSTSSRTDHSEDFNTLHQAPSGKKEEGEGPWLVSYADLMTLLMGFFALIASMSKPDQKLMEKVKQSAAEQFGGHYEQPYKELEKSLKKVLQSNGLDKQVQIEASYDGVTMTFTGTLFFDSGDYKVKPEAIGIVSKLAGTIQKEAKNYDIKVEGHTDDAPISHPIISSNWELSGIRAARIAQVFETQGFQKKQLTLMGWGETKPIVPNENPDGSANLENRTKNRRVVIKVYKNTPES
jgi:chemotaxis protein MotB